MREERLIVTSNLHTHTSELLGLKVVSYSLFSLALSLTPVQISPNNYGFQGPLVLLSCMGLGELVLTLKVMTHCREKERELK